MSFNPVASIYRHSTEIKTVDGLGKFLDATRIDASSDTILPNSIPREILTEVSFEYTTSYSN